MARTLKSVPIQTAAYPASLYPVPELPDLGSLEERRRLSPAAARAFLNIMRRWELREGDALQLLDGLPPAALRAWKNGAVPLLEQDRLLRISYLIGIFKSLHILFSEQLADRWVKLPNSNEIFTAHTPLEYMLRGGAPAMDIVRRLLDARRGG